MAIGVFGSKCPHCGFDHSDWRCMCGLSKWKKFKQKIKHWKYYLPNKVVKFRFLCLGLWHKYITKKAFVLSIQQNNFELGDIVIISINPNQNYLIVGKPGTKWYMVNSPWISYPQYLVIPLNNLANKTT